MSDFCEILTSAQKALKINLDPNIYGTFAEIGAGQEVARNFFRVGAAAGTIAKAISAYDMTVSDTVYGKSRDGRYVSESRLHDMLEKEYSQIVERLRGERSKDTRFFAFADTVAAKSYRSNRPCHGWMGLRFEHEAGSKSSGIAIHVRMLDNLNSAQTEALGILGVNLVFASFYRRDSTVEFVSSLMEELASDRIEIDSIRVEGPAFSHLDSRVLSLELVKKGITRAVMFNELGQTCQASDELYKKNPLVLRGSFRPPTLLNSDMIESGGKEFFSALKVEKKNQICLAEISMNHLLERGEVDNEDFLARVDLLSCLNLNVLVTNYDNFSDLGHYLHSISKKEVGFVMNLYNLEEVFRCEKDHESNVLERVSTLFNSQCWISVYPEWREGKISTLDEFKAPSEACRRLYEFFYEMKRIIRVKNYNEESSQIWSREVLKKILEGDNSWQNLVPESVAKEVKKKKLFNLKD